MRTEMASEIAFVLFPFARNGSGIISKKNDRLNSIQSHGTIHTPYYGRAKPFLKNPELIEEVNLDDAGNVLLNLIAGDYVLFDRTRF